jgi:hypothetical protein
VAQQQFVNRIGICSEAGLVRPYTVNLKTQLVALDGKVHKVATKLSILYLTFLISGIELPTNQTLRLLKPSDEEK